ncbi:hypothetical protein M569_17634 [Genlisea aurea]|uniref:Uncharacterized protein n=1 Tax=Genlisea aurea TaxID=192259 RepID=S8DCU9_9LAMI|nr:hypothetical protein M569_17634 [Genlisea aurea]
MGWVPPPFRGALQPVGGVPDPGGARRKGMGDQIEAPGTLQSPVFTPGPNCTPSPRYARGIPPKTVTQGTCA